MHYQVRIVMTAICTVFYTGCCFDIDNAPPDGISLRVSDAASGSRILTDTLRVTARSGDYVDMNLVTSFGPEGDFVIYVLARGRPGLYNIEVEANGYEPWVREGVWLQRSGVFCNRTEEQAFDVRLQPTAES